MSSGRVNPSISSLLAYLLVILPYTPFTSTPARASLSVKPVRFLQEQLDLPHRDAELLVRFRGGVSPRDKEIVAASYGVRKIKKLRGESGFDKLELSGSRDPKTAALELLMNPQVEFAEPNFLISKDDLTPNDPQFNDQWMLRNTGQSGGQYGADINASGAWHTTTGSTATVIAVIDSGIDFTHSDLRNNQWTNLNGGAEGDLHGWDYITDSGVIKDEQGHGTAVAGIIAAEGNNSLGVTGVMWRASLMSLRVLDNTGAGDVADAVEAIDYAVTNGAQVINLSWGTAAESMALKDAIERATKRHVVVVCSAGNGGRDLSVTPYYPSSFAIKGMIAVAASDNSDQLPSWSNWGSRIISVAAPGTNILTTQMGGGYWNVTGTSAAAPVVSGIAGLMKTIRRSTNAKIISKAISDGVRPSASFSGKVSSGGVVNAADGLEKLHGAANQSPPFSPPGENGQGGSFTTTPPPPVTSGSIANLPNLDQARNAQPQQPSARIPIQSNLMCADCDPLGGGGGGGNHPSGDPNFSTARTRPTNQTGQAGVDLGSRNFNWGLPLLSLPGRAGLDLSLTLHYNSLVWTKDGSNMKFNADFGSPAPGFRLSFPILQKRFLNSQTGIHAYMMVTPSGGRVELRQTGANSYESQDSSYTHLDDSNPSALLVRTTDGTQFTFEPVNVNNEFRCTRIKDRNGNYISATYNASNGHLLTIRDTLDRVINFDYDGNNNLQAIRQAWAGGPHLWATFEYTEVFVAPAFGGGLLVNGPNNSNHAVLNRVNLHDGTYFTFEYNTAFAQVKRINHYAADGHLLSYTSYNVSSGPGQTECPRFTERRDWAEHWNNGNEAITSYSVATDNSWAQQTAPDGTIYKEFFVTSGWQSGLTTATEVWSLGVKRKWTTVIWTQDDTNLSYQKNRRVTETNVWDEANNQRRVTISYGPYTTYGLPYEVIEYAADGATMLRRTYTDYNLDASFTTRRIIGLVSAIHVVNHATNTCVSKTTFDYDWGGEFLVATAQTPTQHDSANYGSSFVTGRGNLSAVWRWDVTDINNATKAIAKSRTGYNTTGSSVFSRDALAHQTSINYGDSFSDLVNRNTFAYPTTITDPATFASTVQYNYDFGAVTRTQDPKGAVQTIIYDSAARVDRIINETNDTYTRHVYDPSGYIKTYATIQEGEGEAYHINYFDGAGRVRASAGDHPGSLGEYSAVLTFHDVMGRVSQQTNPTEINASWVPSGDDSAGWVSSTQTYDWNGRPLRTTNPDLTYRENTYGGCGCAGGEQTTARDERGRRKRFTKDVLGRLTRVEELNWNETVYSTTNYTFNVRDQITQINQQGQTRTFAYDGYGRLNQTITPEQGSATYTYFADDDVQTVTDARGATTTFVYNNRGLVNSITYGVPSGVADTPNVTFGYDSAGNRTSMTDGLGSVTYVYNTLSRMTSEITHFYWSRIVHAELWL